MNRPHDSHENASLARRSEASRIPASVLPDTTITRPGNHQRGGQPAELAHSFDRKDRQRDIGDRIHERVGGVGANRARRSIGKIHHEQQHAAAPPEPRCSKQAAEQRVRRRRDAYLARQ